MVTSQQIKYVFVLMLENHSYDAMLGLKGAIDPYPSFSNEYNKQRFFQSSPAPLSMTTDPGHELDDTLQQLTNITPLTPPLGPYPRDQFPANFENNTGFVTNYVTNTDENNPNPPAQVNYGDVMKCFSADQLPVFNQLAAEFALCTNWFSSLPGPTWPNRFFLHLASSNGMDCSPTQDQLKQWATPGDGFTANNGSIFEALSNAGLNYRIYNDCEKWGFNSCFSDDAGKGGGSTGIGWIPQVGSLSGIDYNSWYELQAYFAGDLNGEDPYYDGQTGAYNYQYTFIEPHYGNIYNNTYEGGSSQHPMDDIAGGEAMLKFVYETLCASPIWDQSLLIVTYDEHGGFYDSVAPPSAIPPGDGSPGYGAPGTLNLFGFEFDQLGVRVPALLISPLIPAGTIDNTQYDHTSVLATLETLFGVSNLTDRDANATNVLGKLTLDTARLDCPTTLKDVIPSKNKRATLTAEQMAAIDLQPIPQSGNIVGSMGILVKMHLEISDPSLHDSIRQEFAAIQTKGQLKAYAANVGAQVQEKRMMMRGSR